jgi:hypothetical protein
MNSSTTRSQGVIIFFNNGEMCNFIGTANVGGNE